MKKILLLLSLSFSILFSATPKQIDEYLSLSKSDRSLLEIEQMIDQILPEETSKNTESIKIKFREYLEKNLSEQEVIELNKLYRNPLFSVLVDIDPDIPEEELMEFNRTLKENPLSTERMELNNKILEGMFDEEIIEYMVVKMQNLMAKQFGIPSDVNLTKEDKKEMLSSMQEELKIPLLYQTQTLSLDELKELESLSNSALVLKTNKVVLHATFYAMEDFFHDIVQSMINESMKVLGVSNSNNATPKKE